MKEEGTLFMTRCWIEMFIFTFLNLDISDNVDIINSKQIILQIQLDLSFQNLKKY